jgi:hypothetical protein
MVNEFVETTQYTNKKQTFWALVLVVCENFIPKNGASTQVMWNATIGAEELAVISSYHTLSADKK